MQEGVQVVTEEQTLRGEEGDRQLMHCQHRQRKPRSTNGRAYRVARRGKHLEILRERNVYWKNSGKTETNVMGTQ